MRIILSIMGDMAMSDLLEIYKDLIKENLADILIIIFTFIAGLGLGGGIMEMICNQEQEGQDNEKNIHTC